MVAVWLIAGAVVMATRIKCHVCVRTCGIDVLLTAVIIVGTLILIGLGA